MDTLKLTAEIFSAMQPTNRTYDADSLPTSFTPTYAEWSNKEKQYSIILDIKTKTFTGSYYDWDDEEEEWKDTERMTAEEILKAIHTDKLILVRR